jgi:non-heme chloroperoxidase
MMRGGHGGGSSLTTVNQQLSTPVNCQGQMRAMEPFGAPLLTAWTRAAAAGAVWLVVSGFTAGPGMASGGAEPVPGIRAVESRSFITSDGARLHYLEAGPRSGPGETPPQTVVFVPGWTMPGWIFQHQIDALKDRFHVLALDPRGQGESEVTAYGYSYERRGRDIGDLIDQCADGPVVLVGWSLGVLDSLAYVAGQGDAKIAGLVLIDNSVGEEPAPVARAGASTASPADRAEIPEDERRRRRAAFVASMFAHDPGADYRARLTDQALGMTQADERRLLAYDVPRTYWRAALHSTGKPVLYVVRPRLRAQGENLVRTHADARMEVFEDAGHALFVDDADRFDALLIDFLDHRVAPRSDMGTMH